MSEPTPGPWTLTYYDDDTAAAIYDADGGMVAYLEDVTATEADLRLVAAAPDLLRALMEVCQSWYATQSPGELPHEYHRAMRAIAKARGDA